MKSACCNVSLPSTDFTRFCANLERHGFDGVELDPQTISADDGAISFRKVRVVLSRLERYGLRCAGFHRLLYSPPGFNLLSDDPDIREKSWSRIALLARVCDDMGGDVVVIGSGDQRWRESMDVATAEDLLIRELAALCDSDKNGSSRFGLEPLPPHRSNVVNSIKTAAKLADRVGTPRVCCVFDFHNAAGEAHSYHDLVYRYAHGIGHVHINSATGGVPDQDSREHCSALRALRQVGFADWVSLEVLENRLDASQTLRRTQALITHAAG